MASGSSLTQWKVISLFRQYLSRNIPAASTDTLTKELSLMTESLSNKLNTNSESEQVKTENKPNAVTEPIDISETPSTYTNIRQAITSINSYMPQLRQSSPQSEPPKNKKEQLPSWRTRKKTSVSQSSVDARTRHLIGSLGDMSERVLLKRLEDVCLHLRTYPCTKNTAIKSLGIPRLLKLMQTNKEEIVQENLREALALLGYSGPVKGRGIRLLSIDGGGVRGLVAIELLRELEERSGKPIYELFDYICGVSTGAIVAVLIGSHKLSMEDCKRLYKELSFKIFSQTTIKGTASLMWNNSFYDSDAWAQVLKDNVGTTSLIQTTRKPDVPKLCVVATQADANLVKAFLFRNYALPNRVGSQYEGSHSATLWESVRASAAAPGYFSEFKIDDNILMDGGIMVNNPTAIGIHEARLLWPDCQFQTVVSLGTGRHDPPSTEINENINWSTRIKTIINSATDTESVHTTMQDLLPLGSYYRLNPYLSEMIGLDEIRTDKLSKLTEETRLYIRKNDAKVSNAVDCLLCTKNLVDQLTDYCNKQKILWAVR